MARTLLDFAKAMDVRAAALSQKASDASVRKALAIMRYLVRVTPVDTSRAVSNWQVSLNSPVTAPHGAFSVGTHGSSYDVSADATLNFAQAVLASKKPGESIYISNVLPYITYLDHGSSSQFPGGFVAGAHLIARITK